MLKEAPGRLDIAFNARDALFYLVRQNKIDILNGISGNRNEVSIVEGYPAMEYTDHMIYDTLTNQLLSYSLHEKLVSALSVDEGNGALVKDNWMSLVTTTMHVRLIHLILHFIFLEDMDSINIGITCIG